MACPVTTVASLFLLVFYACFIPTDSVFIPSSCCMSFVSKKIPESRVVSYQLANGSICPMAGVIFTTKKGQKLCSEPRQPWVQRYMRNLNAKKQRQRPPAVAKALGIKDRAQRCHGNSTAV